MTVGLTKPIYTPFQGPYTTAVLDVLPGTISLGAADEANKNGVTYHAAAFQVTAGKVAVGTYTGTGGPQSITGLGFSPDMVIWVSDDDFLSYLHSPASAGDVVQTFEGGDGGAGVYLTSLDADGFTVSNNPNGLARLNIVYYWVAFQEAANFFEGVSYTGTGVDGLAVTGAGFTPDFAVVKSRSIGVQALARFAANVGDDSIEINATSAADQIQTFGADGITVGTYYKVNNPGTTYHGLFFKTVADTFEQFSWTGNGTAQVVDLSGFTPSFMWIQADDAENSIFWIAYPPPTQPLAGALATTFTLTGTLTGGVVASPPVVIKCKPISVTQVVNFTARTVR